MTRRLRVRMHDADVGHVERDAHGRIVLHYDDRWRTSGHAVPLSISLPLSSAQHRTGVEAYLWGLLPDNEAILERWASRFQTSARNAIGLLAQVGADCPGAVEFHAEGSSNASSRNAVDWLDEGEIARRLRDLRADSSAWREGDDAGQFSLGGAQAKTAFIEKDGRWGVPSGRTPTTHIFKPGMRELRGHAENEHFCLALVRELGLPAARSTVRRFEDETAIVVERYDRIRRGRDVIRVHQEDLCQATATMPATKYQNEGGPGAATIIDTLRTHSGAPQEDVATFIDALVIAWAIVATDGHAKNYSLLHAPGRSRLAPLYDVASILPYEPNMRKVKLAMSIGGKYRVGEIGALQWTRFAKDVGVAAEMVMTSVARIAKTLPDAADTVRKAAHRDGIRHPIVKTLADSIAKRARVLARGL